MPLFEQLLTYLENDPEGRARVLRTVRALGAMPKAARAAVHAERNRLKECHPTVDGGALLHVAAVRLAGGITEQTEAQERAALLADVAEGRERAGKVLRVLALAEAEAGPDAWPFRRAVALEELDGIEGGQRRAFLDLFPRALWTAALEEAAGWDDAAWATWDAERQALAARHPWATLEEAGALAWARVSGDFRDGLSFHLVFLAAALAKKARATGEPIQTLAEKGVAWGHGENARIWALRCQSDANAPEGGQRAA